MDSSGQLAQPDRRSRPPLVYVGHNWITFQEQPPEHPIPNEPFASQVNPSPTLQRVLSAIGQVSLELGWGPLQMGSRLSSDDWSWDARDQKRLRCMTSSDFAAALQHWFPRIAGPHLDLLPQLDALPWGPQAAYWGADLRIMTPHLIYSEHPGKGRLLELTLQFIPRLAPEWDARLTGLEHPMSLRTSHAPTLLYFLKSLPLFGMDPVFRSPAERQDSPSPTPYPPKQV